MTGAEILSAFVIVVVTGLFGLMVWMIQRSISRSDKKLDGIDQKMECQGKDLTEIKLGLRDCVKWSDLDDELNPLKADIKNHGNAIVRLQAKCEARHKG